MPTEPLTAEEIAELRRLVPPVARGNFVTLHRTDYERVRELFPRLLDEVEQVRAGAVVLKLEEDGKGVPFSAAFLEWIERARTLLKRIDEGRDSDQTCAACGYYFHAPDCELAALLS